ncbi:hypothetical protein ACFWY9_35790 [Amycolatopsis sp. NPDC059027]|uniref:hypothetical protein n=1 Tax=Amycolatopsis sp. NPDC059027 TaxID=3346709 RepID=UPI003671B5B9
MKLIVSFHMADNRIPHDLREARSFIARHEPVGGADLGEWIKFRKFAEDVYRRIARRAQINKRRALVYAERQAAEARTLEDMMRARQEEGGGLL